MAATDTNYITEREFLDYIKSPADPGDSNIDAAIASASRRVNAFCGRTFYQTAPATVQYFSASWDPCTSLWLLDVDDIATASGLLVATDTSGTGTYSTSWTINTDFILLPVNQQRNNIAGWPYEQLQAVGDKVWPRTVSHRQRPSVRITATFGWAAVPDPVKQATKIYAALLYKLGEAALGVAGFDQFGSVRVRDLPQPEQLLTPYRTGDTFGIG